MPWWVKKFQKLIYLFLWLKHLLTLASLKTRKNITYVHKHTNTHIHMHWETFISLLCCKEKENRKNLFSVANFTWQTFAFYVFIQRELLPKNYQSKYKRKIHFWANFYLSLCWIFTIMLITHYVLTFIQGSTQKFLRGGGSNFFVRTENLRSGFGIFFLKKP